MDASQLDVLETSAERGLGQRWGEASSGCRASAEALCKRWKKAQSLFPPQAQASEQNLRLWLAERCRPDRGREGWAASDGARERMARSHDRPGAFRHRALCSALQPSLNL